MSAENLKSGHGTVQSRGIASEAAWMVVSRM